MLTNINTFLEYLPNIQDGYVIGDITFKFPAEELYPNLPVVNDSDSTIYPQEGRTICGGFDILAAVHRGCHITAINEAIYIPFLRDTENNIEKPYLDVVKILQTERKKHEKGSVKNTLLKLVLNSIYGCTASGMNYKHRFNTQSEETEYVRMFSKISDPLVASYTTSLVRGTVAEQLWNDGGHKLSITVDG